ncbi:MAG TPA: ferritin family protein [Methanoregulaceae archaeon]|nr:ferritin family protein [Methanoregulaceae archaeon]
MKSEEYRQIISDAIEQEIESYDFYRYIADKVRDSTLKSIFAELADEEMQHHEVLKGYLSKDAKALKFDPSHDYRVAQTTDLPRLSTDMKPVEGLVLAIRKELAAMQVYTQCACGSDDTEQQMVFQQLANMERGHKAKLEDIYTNMAFPEVW